MPELKPRLNDGGGVIDQSDEAQRLLKYHEAEAATLNAKTIVLKLNPTRAAIFEELIHTAQYRTGRATGANIIEMEVEATEKLLRFADRYGLNKEDVKAIESRLNNLLMIN